jgi:hypothetical protein
MTMQELSGGCHCGNIQVDVRLTRAPESYNPRACDCDFCRLHRAAYVSDSQGSLHIRVRDQEQLGRYRQGSGRAELLLCRNCGVLIAPLLREGEKLYASVNVRVIEAGATFGAEQVVSPKKLAESDKVKRWHDIWFAQVTLS